MDEAHVHGRACIRRQPVLALPIASPACARIGHQLGVTNQPAFRDVAVAVADIMSVNMEKAE